MAPIGFILSLIAVFTIGPSKAKGGRGLAIAGLIISVVLMAISAAVIIGISKSTVADPGCTTGKSAILDNSKTVDATSVQKTIDGLNAAAAKAKHDNVAAAMKAMAADYTRLGAAMKTGNMPAGLQDKLNADADKIDSLCTVNN